jgi:hypothetical protein
LPELVHGWGQDTRAFLRHDGPKILLVILVSFLLIRILQTIAGKFAALQTRRLPPGFRLRQVRTLASVVTSVGVFVILFVAALEFASLIWV